MKSIDKFVLVLVASLALLLAGCGGGGSTEPEGPTAEEIAAEMRAMDQKEALENANDALDTALAATLNTQGALDAANAAHTALADAIAAAADVSAADKAKYEHAASAAMDRIADAQKIFDAAEADRIAREQAEQERIAREAEEQRMKEEAEAAAAMAATASKLYAGISPFATTGDAIRNAAYNGANIDVTIGAAAAVSLSEDEDATVAAHHGWEGQMFTASPAGGGTYEAVVYSHPDDPTVTEGAVFNVAYTLTDGETGDVANLTGHDASRVASPSFDQSAGTKTFELPDNTVRLVLAGSYQGVDGTYYCTPTNATTDCGATVADMGFTLVGGTWSFKPTNPEARLMDTSADDADYASYGWWLHKSDDDETYTASAFAVYRGTAPTVTIDTLRGSATYTGGAAGKYALRSSTGGTNDAGHFTADVTLEATFAAVHSITGTVDNFTGGDGESRDWSVALGKSVVAGGGAIAGALAADGTADGTNTGPQMTTWTIGGVAGDAGGQWSGNLHEVGDDGVPAIGTGTFYSTFAQDGRMVGAFGVNVDD